jgi:hypothetical protein
MKKRTSRIIVGTVIGAAAIAAAIDHTRHRLPEPAPAADSMESGESGEAGESEQSDMDESPCGMGESPCSM